MMCLTYHSGKRFKPLAKGSKRFRFRANLGNRFGQVHTRTVSNQKKTSRINVESGKTVLVTHEEKQKSGSQPSPFSHRQARCRRIPQIPQRLPIEDERSLHKRQVFRVRSQAATECRFKKVQSGSKRFEQVQRMCRFEPNRWITPNTPKRFASLNRFGSGSGFLDPPVRYGSRMT